MPRAKKVVIQEPVVDIASESEEEAPKPAPKPKPAKRVVKKVVPPPSPVA